MISYDELSGTTHRHNVRGQPIERSRAANYHPIPIPIVRHQRPKSTDYGGPEHGNIQRQGPDSSLYWKHQQPRRTAQSFRHRALRRPDTQHRLINILPYRSGSPIRCIMRHVDLGVQDWTAVSYTWGIEEASKSILVGYEPDQSDAKPLLITKNLCDILLHISRMRNTRPDQERWRGWWWIDALCIIQDDEYWEKDIQIKSMQNFYEGASEVFAWIGPGDSVTDEAMHYIRKNHSSFRDAAARGVANAQLVAFENSFHKFAHCVRDIFRRPYWTRLWILQELAMSPNTILVCGNEELPWKTFMDFAIQVAAADFGPHGDVRQVQREIVGKQTIWLLTQINLRRKRRPNLAELVFLSKNAECGKDKKDYVRALLGMVGRGRGTHLDPEKHRSACSIISHATRIIIQDMREDDRIPRNIKQRCEKLARLAHHNPLLVHPELDQERAYCTDYKAAQQDCRDIASTLYERTALLRSRIKSTGETWDFEQESMRRRRSRSRSRSSVASRGRSQSPFTSMSKTGSCRRVKSRASSQRPSQHRRRHSSRSRSRRRSTGKNSRSTLRTSFDLVIASIVSLTAIGIVLLGIAQHKNAS